MNSDVEEFTYDANGNVLLHQFDNETLRICFEMLRINQGGFDYVVYNGLLFLSLLWLPTTVLDRQKWGVWWGVWLGYVWMVCCISNKRYKRWNFKWVRW